MTFYVERKSFLKTFQILKGCTFYLQGHMEIMDVRCARRLRTDIVVRGISNELIKARFVGGFGGLGLRTNCSENFSC